MTDRNLAVDAALSVDDIIRVSAGSDPQAVATAISTAFYEREQVLLRAIGAGAVNQSQKAVAVARGYIATRGLDLYERPGWVNVPGREDPTTGERKSISALLFRLSLQ